MTVHRVRRRLAVAVARLAVAVAAGGRLAFGLGRAARSRHGRVRAGSAPRPADPPRGRAAGTGRMRVDRNLAYAPVSRAQRLDLYRPPVPVTAGSVRTGLPVVLTIHGGAFAVGDKRNDLPMVHTLVRAGYAVASVNYRLSGEARFPAAVQDVKAAVRWLRAHADVYGLDPARIAAIGESAGAYLAVMLGATPAVAMFDDPALGNVDVPSDVQAVVDLYGPVNFASMDAHARANSRCTVTDARHDEADSPESRFLGRTVAQAPDLVRVASPLHYLGAGPLPPFLIEHGDADCTVPHGQSLELAAALQAAGSSSVDLAILPGAGHGAAFPLQERMPAVVAFLDRSLVP